MGVEVRGGGGGGEVMGVDGFGFISISDIHYPFLAELS